mmetsp:Transcript_48878/g.146103  ORF Transcript_48878/g.146103 Transcript_48878/m.146103 type:complete len:323 (+) Transcript_48878:549-1517(+)
MRTPVRSRCSAPKSPCTGDAPVPLGLGGGRPSSTPRCGPLPLARETRSSTLAASAARPFAQRKRGDSGRSFSSHAVARTPGADARRRARHGAARTAKATATSSRTPAFQANPSSCFALARCSGGENSAISGYRTLNVPTAPTAVTTREATTAWKDTDAKVSRLPARCKRLKSRRAARRPRTSATAPERRNPAMPPMNQRELRSCCCTSGRPHCSPRAGARNAQSSPSTPTKAYTSATFTASLVWKRPQPPASARQSSTDPSPAGLASASSSSGGRPARWARAGCGAPWARSQEAALAPRGSPGQSARPQRSLFSRSRRPPAP